MKETAIKVGMVVAVELSAAKKRYGKRMKQLPHRGFELHYVDNGNYEIFIVNCGAGEIASAAACQMLISEYNVDMIVNFGVVGGLTPEMKVARVCAVESVVNYDFDTSEFTGQTKAKHDGYPSVYIPTDEALLNAAVRLEPSLKRVICASGDRFIASADEKRSLHDEFNADVCEMEAAGIALTCNRSSVPCLLIKAVSDAVEGGAEEFAREIDRCAELCLETLEGVVSGLLS